MNNKYHLIINKQISNKTFPYNNNKDNRIDRLKYKHNLIM